MQIALELPEDVERRIREDGAVASMAPEDYVVQLVKRRLAELDAHEKLAAMVKTGSHSAREGEQR